MVQNIQITRIQSPYLERSDRAMSVKLSANEGGQIMVLPGGSKRGVHLKWSESLVFKVPRTDRDAVLAQCLKLLLINLLNYDCLVFSSVKKQSFCGETLLLHPVII